MKYRRGEEVSLLCLPGLICSVRSKASSKPREGGCSISIYISMFEALNIIDPKKKLLYRLRKYLSWQNENNFDIKKLVKIYFNQPKILYQHLFSSYNQLVEEIIPYSLVEQNNYFYENVDGNFINIHGFRCKNIKIKPELFYLNKKINKININDNTELNKKYFKFIKY